MRDGFDGLGRAPSESRGYVLYPPYTFKGIVRKKENPHVRVMCVLLLVRNTHTVLSYCTIVVLILTFARCAI
jgi:hypothetical protein